jgi:C2 domain
VHPDSLCCRIDTLQVPCCRLSVRNRVTKRTRVVWNSRCPKWNEEFRFLVHFPGAVALVVRHLQGACLHIHTFHVWSSL